MTDEERKAVTPFATLAFSGALGILADKAAKNDRDNLKSIIRDLIDALEEATGHQPTTTDIALIERARKAIGEDDSPVDSRIAKAQEFAFNIAKSDEERRKAQEQRRNFK